MSELKIGGFRSNPSSAQQYAVEDVDTSFDQPDLNPNNDPNPVPPTDPVDQPTDTNPDDGSNSEPSNPEPNQHDGVDNNDQGSDAGNPVPTPPAEVKIDDSIALQYLSEKLGREVQSFDELNKPQAVENPLESDPYLKTLYEWRQKTGRPIEDWVKYQKDYDSLSDVEIAREYLQHEYPTFTKEEIELELDKFIPNQLDDEREERLKQLELKKYATRGRQMLTQIKQEFAQPSTNIFPEEVKQKISFAEKAKEQFQLMQSVQEQNSIGIKQAVTSIDSIKLDVGDGNTVLEFKLSDEIKREIPSYIQNAPSWINEDGTQNHTAVVTSAIRDKYFNDILKIVYQQGLEAGKDLGLADVNNVNLTQPDRMSPSGSNGKGAVIEGLDNFLKSGGLKVRTKG